MLNRMIDEHLRDVLKEDLIRADMAHSDLGLRLFHIFSDLTGDGLSWDPDADYTPLEAALHHLAEDIGLDYHKDIFLESKRRREERKRLIEEARHRHEGGLID